MMWFFEKLSGIGTDDGYFGVRTFRIFENGYRLIPEPDHKGIPVEAPARIAFRYTTLRTKE
jgi:hypothetical protein